MEQLHIIVTCTDRKRAAVPVDLRLQTVPDGDVVARCENWINRLEGAPGPRHAAGELYAGEHWQVASDLPSSASAAGLRSQLWVASAGYGLIGPDAPIAPYAATFSPRQPDSVVRTGEPSSGARDWWQRLAKWSGPDACAPRSISALVQQDAAPSLMVVASAVYVHAMLDDLREAIASLRVDQRLAVVSLGFRPPDWLSRYTVPGDARLQHFLGGTMQALNVRFARWILTTLPTHRLDPALLTPAADELLAAQPPITRYDRAAMCDDEVVAFITRALHADPGASRNRLLRQLRDSGHACEQQRFRRLFALTQQGPR